MGKFQLGLSTPAIVTIILVILVLSGGVFVFTRNQAAPGVQQTSQNKVVNPANLPPQNTQDATQGGQTHSGSYTGQILAGQASPLLVFNQTDYQQALQNKKLVVLYFYANWCPICRAEFPKMESAFNKLTTDQVVGFRVNFNDNETDDTERDLARQFGVAYQHTKVFIKNGERVLKSPESWEEEKYFTEINGFL
jgi:thiol-disulfide isomerase/thioredoxin